MSETIHVIAKHTYKRIRGCDDGFCPAMRSGTTGEPRPGARGGVIGIAAGMRQPRFSL
jgi:hypothetical protein